MRNIIFLLLDELEITMHNLTHGISAVSYTHLNSIVAGSFNKKEKDVVTTGYPRVDLLFQDSDVLEKLNIDKSTCKKIVLYMPTCLLYTSQ